MSVRSFKYYVIGISKYLHHIIIRFSELGCVNVADELTCNEYKSNGYCTQTYQAWMKLNCNKACKLCTGKPPNIDIIHLNKTTQRNIYIIYIIYCKGI